MFTIAKMKLDDSFNTCITLAKENGVFAKDIVIPPKTNFEIRTADFERTHLNYGLLNDLNK